MGYKKPEENKLLQEFASLDEASQKRLIKLAKEQSNIWMTIFDVVSKVASIISPFILYFQNQKRKK